MGEFQRKHKILESLESFLKLFRENFEQTSENQISPNNFKQLKENQEFINTFSFYYYSKMNLYQQNVDYYNELERLRLEIEKYLSFIDK